MVNLDRFNLLVKENLIILTILITLTSGVMIFCLTKTLYLSWLSIGIECLFLLFIFFTPS